MAAAIENVATKLSMLAASNPLGIGVFASQHDVVCPQS